MSVLDTRERERGDSRSTPPGGLSEGERWAREAVDRLRARRFSAPGLVELLAASLARARRVRASRPELVSQSRRFGAIGLAGSVPLGPRAVVRWLGWWAMLDWHLGMVESGGFGPGRGLETDGEPRARALETDGEPQRRALGVADALTLARLWAAPLARRTPHPAVIAVASATDVVDGLLARRAGPTRLGRDLDPAADACFFHAAVSGLVERGVLAPWILAAERANVIVAVAVGVARYVDASARPATAARRAIPATLGASGLLLAATTAPRGRSEPGAGRGSARARRGSHALLAAAIAARTWRGLRPAGGPRAGAGVG